MVRTALASGADCRRPCFFFCFAESCATPFAGSKRSLQPVRQWPSLAQIGHVVACDEEWYEIVQLGLRLVHGDKVVQADIFRDPYGSTVELLRCIQNLAPMSAYFRRLRGDSSLLPSVSRLGLIVPVEGETLEIDSERSLRSTCFACLQPGRASWLCLKSLVQCTPMVTLMNGSHVTFTAVPWRWSARWSLPDAWCSTSQVPRASAGSFHSTLSTA